MQVLFILLVFRDQNSSRLKKVFVPNNYHAVKSCMCSNIDNDDERLKDYLWEFIIPGQNIITTVLFLLSTFYQFLIGKQKHIKLVNFCNGWMT